MNDEIHITRIEPIELSKEQLKWIEKHGFGIVPAKYLTKEECEEKFGKNKE